MYLFQVTVYTGLMLLIYRSLLQNKAMHSFNRVYLLSCIIIPLLLPLLKIPDSFTPTFAGNLLLPETIINNANNTSTVKWMVILKVLYLSIVILLVIRLLINYLRLNTIIKRSSKKDLGSYTVLENTGYGPASWGRYVFLPSSESSPMILQHELAHIKHRHSWDILLLSIVQAVIWPNVFIYYLRKELLLVHEFQADEGAGNSSEEYSNLLLQSAFKTCTIPFTHSLIFHPIKRRIMMLNKKRESNNRLKIVTVALLFAMVFGITTVQSCTEKSTDMMPITKSEYNKLTKEPHHPFDLMTFMIEHVKYPEAAYENSVEGKVLVQFTIDPSGKVINPTVINPNEVDEELQKSALEAISQMPDWEAGEINGKKVAVNYTMPVNFKMPEASDSNNNS